MRIKHKGHVDYGVPRQSPWPRHVCPVVLNGRQCVRASACPVRLARVYLRGPAQSRDAGQNASACALLALPRPLPQEALFPGRRFPVRRAGGESAQAQLLLIFIISFCFFFMCFVTSLSGSKGKKSLFLKHFDAY